MAAAVGTELAARRLSPAERDAAVDGLIAYLQATAEPHPMAVWALTKSYEPRAVPALIALLDRWVNEPRAVPLAYQALVGVVTSGLTTPEYREQSLAALRRAAAQGHTEVAETAQRYLRTLAAGGWVRSQRVRPGRQSSLAGTGGGGERVAVTGRFIKGLFTAWAAPAIATIDAAAKLIDIVTLYIAFETKERYGIEIGYTYLSSTCKQYEACREDQPAVACKHDALKQAFKGFNRHPDRRASYTMLAGRR